MSGGDAQTMTPVKAPKKLIEVALPLDRINEAAAKEKSIRHGHPSTLHLWWARRPLAAARAVIFGQLVNDPSWKWEMERPGEVPPNHLKATWAKSRKRLFGIIEEIVKWPKQADAKEMAGHEAALEQAREEIRKSWRETCELNRDHPQAAELFNPDKLPGLHDPFAGGGTIPLEAQRLGLEAFASDLNPVAVLINKAMIEIPPRFAGRAPIGPLPKDSQTREIDTRRAWPGATGLAEDVRRYGAWMREEAEKRIGHLYPPVDITAEMAHDRPDLQPLIGQKLTVIAWIWARTVKSPNPAFRHVDVPLASTFVLSSKEGEGKGAYVQPVVEGDRYRFEVRVGTPPTAAQDGTKLGRGSFRCLVSGAPVDGSYVRREGTAGRMGRRLLATVAEGDRGRSYLSPTYEMEVLASRAKPQSRPELAMPENPRWFSPPLYGLRTYGDLFTERQLVALETFSDLVIEARGKTRCDAVAAGYADDPRGLDAGGTGATSYADAVSVLLAFTTSRLADRCSTICSWDLREGQGRKPGIRNVFSRQAIPMTWDYAEANPMSEIAASMASAIWRVSDVLDGLPARGIACAWLADAASLGTSTAKVISTDPPYYDNIGYADLSDFFYVWLRRSLKAVFPTLLATFAVPKAEELVATPYRHGSKEKAERFFLDGMTRVMHGLATQGHPAAPITIYYAFKQAETKGRSGTASTGWETFLEAVHRSGLALTGTWPMRTELGNRMIGAGNNALASSIVLVCRPRAADAPTTSRRGFLRELNQALPEALDEMTRGVDNERTAVAPVDLSQAIIGPGMAVFSKYSAVLEADGSPMAVRTALQLINRFLAEDDFDADTQFCLHWFEQNGWKEGKFGDADTLARAKGTSVEGVKQAGVLDAGGGTVRLLKWAEYPEDWDPKADARLPIWEVLHQLIRLTRTQGESGAGAVLAAIQDKAEPARQLAYRLYTLCERAGWAEDARAYNELVTGWTGIESAAATAVAAAIPPQRRLQFEE